MSALDRFVHAQDAGGAFDAALGELRAGRKRGHWIWFVLPQLEGLGTSHMARAYAIRDEEEAVAYLQHPVLGARLRAVAGTVAGQLARGRRVDALMGSSIDAAKLVSSMTLFTHVAERLHGQTAESADALVTAGRAILAEAASQGHPPCAYTLQRLGPGRGP